MRTRFFRRERRGAAPGAAILTALLVALVAFAGCQDDAAGPSGGPGAEADAVITGTVTIEGPILSATVGIELRGEGVDRATTTDPAGNFAFEGVAPGDYELVTRPPGGYWLTAESNPIRVSLTPKEHRELSIAMRQLQTMEDGALVAFVRDARSDSAGVAGATIDVVDRASGESVAGGVTGGDGGVSFDLPPGFYDVEVVEMPDGVLLAPQQANPITDVIVNPEATTAIVFSALSEDLVGEGTLVAHAEVLGQPLAGVEVTVRTTGDGAVVATGTTDADGRAEFTTGTGPHDVEIVVPGGYVLTTAQENPVRGVWVVRDDVVEVTFNLWAEGALPQGDLVAYVVDMGAFESAPDDSLPDPIAGVPVEVRLSSSGASVASGVTDADGFARFPLDADDYDVEIVVPEGYELDFGATNPRQDVTISPETTMWVWFRLRAVAP